MKKTIITSATALVMSFMLVGCGGSDSSGDPIVDNTSNVPTNLVNNTRYTFENNGTVSAEYGQDPDGANVLKILWRRTGRYLKSNGDGNIGTHLGFSTDVNSTGTSFVIKYEDEGADPKNYTGDQSPSYTSFTIGEYSNHTQIFYPHTYINNHSSSSHFLALRDDMPNYLIEYGYDVDLKRTRLVIGEFNSDGNGAFTFTKYDYH